MNNVLSLQSKVQNGAEAPQQTEEDAALLLRKNAAEALAAVSAAETVVSLAVEVAAKAVAIAMQHQASSIDVVLEAAESTLRTAEVAAKKTLQIAKESARQTLELAKMVAARKNFQVRKAPSQPQASA
jgi:hypothetical protein